MFKVLWNEDWPPEVGKVLKGFLKCEKDFSDPRSAFAFFAFLNTQKDVHSLELKRIGD